MCGRAAISVIASAALSSSAAFPGAVSATFAVETAVLDAYCREHELSLSSLFGGAPRTVRTDLTIPIVAPETAAERAARAMEAGFDHLKVKAETDVATDVERVVSVRDAAPEAVLKVDAIDLALLEQPVHKDDLAGLARTCDHVTMPVAADEAVFTPEDALEVVCADAADVVNVKPAKSGHLGTAEMAAIADAANRQLLIGCMLESAVGIHASAHLVAGLGAFDYVGLDGNQLVAEDVIDTTFGPEIEIAGLGQASRPISAPHSAACARSPKLGVQRIGRAEFPDRLTHICGDAVVLGVVQCADDEVTEAFHVALDQAASRSRWRSNANTTGHLRWAGVTGDGISIEDDPDVFEERFGLPPGDVRVRFPEVDEHQVRVRAVGKQIQPVFDKRVGQHFGVGHDLRDVRFERWLEGLFESNGLASDVVHQWIPLGTRKHPGVDCVGVLVVTHNEPTAPRAEALVSRSGDEVRDTNGRGVLAGSHESGYVSDIRHVVGADRVRDGLNLFPADLSGICREPGDDHGGTVLARFLFQFVVIDPSRLWIDVVVNDVIVLSGEVDGVAVAQVAAVREFQRENRVSGIEHRDVYAHIRLRAAVWLDVRVVGTEQFLCAFDGVRLYLVDVFQSREVPRTGIPLSTLVRHDFPLGFKDGGAEVIAACD
jgi:hypothetical protein